jgi:predicted dehydrogenase
MKPLRIAIVGFGKIARDQHVPAIAANPRLELAATVTRGGTGIDAVPCFADHREMLRSIDGLDAAVVSTPPSARYAIASDCLEAGLHTLLEKPPGVTLGEVDDLARIASSRELTLYASWHAQHNPAVSAAAELVGAQPPRSLDIVWHEDVRKWHPGQAWVWEPGGFGVFDPGINALSIASRIVPAPLILQQAELTVPANKQMPIAASLGFANGYTASFDWRHSGGERWTIAMQTAEGLRISLLDGGARLEVDGTTVAGADTGEGEYPSIYARFVDLLDARQSEVNVDPLRIVADAFMMARRVSGDAFLD